MTAELRPETSLAVPASVTVLDSQTLQDAGRTNFEDVLGLIPNLNWAGDTSLPRYFQLRGIGELEQYQGAPNPSVGFLVDDIDFSGIGGVGTLYDLDQVEVLRGPQATRYGANALGGLIYMRSAEPSSEPFARVDLGGGNYRTQTEGGVVSGPVDYLDSGVRLAVQHYATDGYYHDLYLHRYNTDAQNEYTYRLKWTANPTDTLHTELTAFYARIDDGYDAFSIDNTRNTESDQPGVDSQHSSGLALRLHDRVAGDVGLTFIGTYAHSLIKYSYDGDWGNPLLWAPLAEVYQYSEIQDRDRTTKTVELRLASESSTALKWLVGIYGNRLDESLRDVSLGYLAYLGTPVDDVADDQNDSVIDSAYWARNAALYGELDFDLSSWTTSLGVRGERWTAHYAGTTTDFLGSNVGYTQAPVSVVSVLDAYPAVINPSNSLWGGHASLTDHLDANSSLYFTLSRGYKSGGFNLSQGLLANQLYFRPETDVNVELGFKSEILDHRLRFDADVFFLHRHDAQIKTSFQSDPTNPDDFVYYTGNAANGRNYGFEGEAAWRANDSLTLQATLGLLQTRFTDFVQQGADGSTLAVVSRELANSPHWQASFSATYRDPRGPFTRMDITGMGGYYFDLPPNQTTSKPYGLANLKIGWDREHWSVSLAIRNLLDKRYPVRGFYFGDVPPDFVSQTYVQLGEPRTWMLQTTLKLGRDEQRRE